MNAKTLGLFLIVIGVLILVYAMLLMDVTANGTIVNLNLLSIRQNLVIVGAAGTVAGLILRFATASKAATSDDAGANRGEGARANPKLMNRGLRHPARLFRLSSLLLMPFGAFLTYKWLFGPIAESTVLILTAGILMYFGPIFANREFATNPHLKLELRAWLIALPVAALFAAWVLFSMLGFY